MPKPTPETTLGVMIDLVNQHGTNHIVVRVMQRRETDNHPLNISFGVFQDHGAMSDLVLDGFISDTSKEFIAFEPFYDDPNQVKRDRAVAMAKVLERVSKVLRTDNANEHGDVYMAFCKAIGAKWCTHRKNLHRESSLADNQWRWMTVAEGRDYLRRRIAIAEQAARGE